jgi:prolyl-tRNA editing enzyme YbaK/EbsC (Cys-tRNA(Pro) deacylase)
MPMNARVQSFLEGSHVPYELLAHPLAFTAQGVAHASHVSGWQMAKVVVVRPVFVDEHLARENDVVFQAGNHREAVRVSWTDFERAVHPTVADFCKH